MMKEYHQCWSVKGAGLDRLFYPTKIGRIIRSRGENKTIRPMSPIGTMGLKMGKKILKYLLQDLLFQDDDEDEDEDKKREDEEDEEDEEEEV